MKRLICLAVAALLLCGCAAQQQNTPAADAAPDETTPVQTAAPLTQQEVEGLYTLNERTVFYPEGAAEADAEYKLSYTLPVFNESATSAAMNEAVGLYEDGLVERVVNERMPYADRVEGEPVPETVVTCEVSAARGYINIRLDEASGFGAEEEHSSRVLVLNQYGEETDFAAVSGLYAPGELAAQQVWNVIDREDPDRTTYYGDLDTADIVLMLDLYNGFTVNEDGYTLIFQPGTLADESQGIVEISFPASALYPDFVGDVLSEEQYEALTGALNAIACGCALQYESFSDAAPSALASTVFVCELLGEGTHSVSECTAVYERWFGHQYEDAFEAAPGITLAGDDVTVTGLAADYSVQPADMTASGDTLTLTGMLMFGRPGSADASELAALTIVLNANADSPAGYTIEALEIR